MEHWNIIVRGSVQGVFFRFSAKEEADALGVSGFARNEQDGSVYIEAEGSRDALQRFAAWCKKGPEYAIVESVEVEKGALKNLQGFHILSFRSYGNSHTN